MHRTDDNIKTVEKLFQDLVAGKIDAVAAAFDEDAVWEYPAGSALAGKHSGKAGIRSFLENLHKTYTAIEVVRLTLRASDDCVFAEYGWVGSRPDGDKHRDHFLTLVQLGFGKVTAVRQFAMGAVH